MDPSVSAFLTRFETKIESAIDGLTKAQQSTATKIDDLLSWRLDLERRVADLSDAVALLQQAQLALQRDIIDNHNSLRCSESHQTPQSARQIFSMDQMTTALHNYTRGRRRRLA